ncbi:ANTAR domain-containing response regulator [Posidoniimonas polymericola]|nr:ANTAR domain-containing protein [Posidoniimonas polymericola]
MRSIEIVIAHGQDDTATKLHEIVSSLGHTVKATCRSTEDLLSECLPSPPNLIISGVEMDGGNAIDALVRISEHEPTPAIVLTPKRSLMNVEEALRDHVMAYLVEPIDPNQVKPTIYLVCERFKQFELLKAENDDLRQTLVERKVIEKAKGILMGQHELDEEHAFRKLQKLAQSKRTKLASMAQSIVDAAEAQGD